MSFANDPLGLLNHTMGISDLYTILEERSFWAEYEPIIDVKTGEIFGYEALARFWYKGKRYPPAPILKLAHYSKELFFKLEKELKYMQILKRPQEGVLFVNIDPHNFDSADKSAFWCELFSDTSSICIEVTENTDGVNASLLFDILPKLKKTGAWIAQDDIGNDAKPFCFELTTHAHILKFDRAWLKKIEECSDYIHILKGFISYAKLQAKKTIMEGIETKEDLCIARLLGVDFVQGYLYKALNLTSLNTNSTLLS